MGLSVKKFFGVHFSGQKRRKWGILHVEVRVVNDAGVMAWCCNGESLDADSTQSSVFSHMLVSLMGRGAVSSSVSTPGVKTS